MGAKERVNHPQYYGGKENPYEAIKVIEKWFLGFCLGNAVKYISRAGKKVAAKLIEDLEKTVWYLEREIKGTGTTQPAVGLSTFPLDCMPADVITAWGLSGNLAAAVNYIAHSRLCGTNDRSLETAMDFVKREIEILKEAANATC